MTTPTPRERYDGHIDDIVVAVLNRAHHAALAAHVAARALLTPDWTGCRPRRRTRRARQAGAQVPPRPCANGPRPGAPNHLAPARPPVSFLSVRSSRVNGTLRPPSVVLLATALTACGTSAPDTMG